MSSNVPINTGGITAPTPQNTPLQNAPISQHVARPSEMPNIAEGDEIDVEDVKAVLAAGQNTNLLAGLVQGRLSSLIGKSSGYIESLPVPVKRSVSALQGLQVKQEALQKEFKHEVFELERKYLEKSQKLYDRRSQIIHGTSKPTKEEIEEGEKEFSEIEEEYEPLPTDSTESAPIEHFWLTALRNHLGINELITDRDEAALKHLTDVTISYLPKTENRLGYKLSFHFSENEFFEDKVLEKTYIYKPDIDVSGDFIYERALGTQIKWKEDKDLTKEVEVKKQRNKNTNRTRLVRKARPVESFFNFFNPPVPPPSDVAPEDDLDEEEMEELDDRLALDYQIGDDFKDRIIPRAVDYFTGRALEWDAEEWESGNEDDSEDDFDDGDGDEDDEDDEDDSDPRLRAPPKNGAQNEECKNQ